MTEHFLEQREVLATRRLSAHLGAALDSPRVSSWLNEAAMNSTYLPPTQTKAESQMLVGKYQKIIK